jgi:hypothetical protein
MKLRLQYWEKVKDIEPKNLVFLDETGVLLGLTRTHASNSAREPMWQYGSVKAQTVVNYVLYPKRKSKLACISKNSH